MRRKTCTVVQKMRLEDGGGAQNVNRSSEIRGTQNVTKVIGSLSFLTPRTQPSPKRASHRRAEDMLGRPEHDASANIQTYKSTYAKCEPLVRNEVEKANRLAEMRSTRAQHHGARNRYRSSKNKRKMRTVGQKSSPRGASET